MNPDLLVFVFYLMAKVSLYVSVITFLVSGIDDVFFDLYYLIRQSFRRLVVYRKHAHLSERELLSKPEQHLAIFVPAWQEGEVIGSMLLNTLATLDYTNYHIFVGTYPNDDHTGLEVEKVRQLYPNVTRVVCPEDGPTNKADNLNWVYQGMHAFERETGIRFVGVVIHDSEDIVHPLSLKLYNYLLPRFSMVQIPVYPLESPLHKFTAGIYIDEFSENHSKDLLIRERVDHCIPAAGVGCAFSRSALETLAASSKNLLFNTTSLTEDYELGLRLREVPGKKIFVRQALVRVETRPDGRHRIRTEIIATRELFPDRFWDAVAQRSRWTLGIAIQGWRSFGWRGSAATKLVLYRDRKVLVTGFVAVFAYVAFLYFLADIGCRAWLGYTLFPPLVRGDSWIRPLLLVVMGLMVQRLAFRLVLVTRLFGFGHGLVSIPRVFWANLINFCATARAVGQFFASLWTGNAVAWSKTSHRYPSEAQLRLYRRKLGDLLLEQRFITVAQLNQALALQKQQGGLLGEILIEAGALQEEDLQRLLGKQNNVPYQELRPYETELEVLSSVPRKQCERRQLYPVRREGERLVVATSRLEELQQAEKLGELLGERVPPRVVLSSAPDVAFALRRGFQRLTDGAPPSAAYLGSALLELNVITPEQLERALREQKRTDARLGEILVRAGVVDPDVIEGLLLGGAQ